MSRIIGIRSSAIARVPTSRDRITGLLYLFQVLVSERS
jgi:hypothetical protein